MGKLMGYAHLTVDLEVEDGLEDIEYEQLFNQEVQAVFDGHGEGTADYDWDVQEDEE